MLREIFVKGKKVAVSMVAVCAMLPVGDAMQMPRYEIYQFGGNGEIQANVDALQQDGRLELSCQPDEGYYFVEWRATGDTEIIDADKQDATVILPEGYVSIMANYAEKLQTELDAEPQQAVYDGDAKAYEPSISSVDELDETAVEVLYRPLPEGIFRPEEPTQAGEYLVSMSYPGDEKHLPAEAETTLTIEKADFQAKAAEIMQVDYEYAVFKTEGNQRYMLLPADHAAPSTSGGNWVDGTGHPFEWDGLSVGTDYIIYTYAPATKNTAESKLQMTAFNTTHVFSCGVKAINYDMAFPSETSYGQDQPVEVKVTNTGTGKLRDVMVYISGDTRMIELEMDSFTGMLESGQSEIFRIKAAPDAPEGIYRANIMIKAIGNELGSGESFQSDAIDIKFKVDNELQASENAVDPGLLDAEVEQQQPVVSPEVVEQPKQPQQQEVVPSTKPLKQETAPVLQPLVVSDLETVTATDNDVDGGLIASLNAAISDYQNTYTSDEEEQVAAVEPGYNDGAGGGSDTGTTGGTDSTISGTTGTEGESGEMNIEEDPVPAAEAERKEHENRSLFMRMSSLVWFYIVVAVAAVIFGVAVFWADNVLRRRPSKHKAANRYASSKSNFVQKKRPSDARSRSKAAAGAAAKVKARPQGRRRAVQDFTL